MTQHGHRPCDSCGHRADYHNAFGTMPCSLCDCNRLRLPAPKEPRPKPAKEPKPVTLSPPSRWLADARAIRRHALEAVRQCDIYLGRGWGHLDEMRVGYTTTELSKALQIATRADARYDRESDLIFAAYEADHLEATLRGER